MDHINDFLYSQKPHNRKNALKRKTHTHIHAYNYDPKTKKTEAVSLSLFGGKTETVF